MPSAPDEMRVDGIQHSAGFGTAYIISFFYFRNAISDRGFWTAG